MLDRIASDLDPPDMEIEVRTVDDSQPKITSRNFIAAAIRPYDENHVSVPIWGSVCPPYAMSQADWLDILRGIVRQVAVCVIDAAVFQGVPAAAARRNVLLGTAEAVGAAAEAVRE